MYVASVDLLSGKRASYRRFYYPIWGRLKSRLLGDPEADLAVFVVFDGPISESGQQGIGCQGGVEAIAGGEALEFAGVDPQPFIAGLT